MKTYLDYQDIELIELAAANARDKLLIRLLSRLGCRISEVLSIQLKDIDFEDEVITILHLKKRVKTTCSICGARLSRKHQYCPECGIKVSDTVKNQQERRRMRVLPVDRGTIEMIKSYIGNSNPYNNGLMPLFNINRHRAWQVVRECANRAGIRGLINPETGRDRGVSPHRFRDAFSVHAIKTDDSGDGLRLLQEHLGHASFNTTASYRKVAGDEHRNWYNHLWIQESNPTR
jgi:integrase/recombinase XerD